MALPLAGGESRMLMDDNAYVEATLSVMKKFSVTATKTDYGLMLGAQEYISPMTVFPEADWFAACYLILANALGGDIKCGNLNGASLRPGRRITDMLGAILNGRADNVDCSDFPDSLPLMCVAACAVKSTVALECRAHCAAEAIRQSLSSLGAHITFDGNALTVEGQGILDGGTAACHGSRHLAMSLAVASMLCRNPIIIEDYRPAADSVFDAFLSRFVMLGGKIKIV
jgi:3-phosphoshikimate 1-carboxyvinyltransferase